MNRHIKKHTEEEARRMAEEEETRAERQNRRERYYGSDGNSTQYKRHPHIFLFRPEDLDNEDVILQVENTPTYKRTRQTLEDIRNLASGNVEVEEAKKKTITTLFRELSASPNCPYLMMKPPPHPLATRKGERGKD